MKKLLIIAAALVIALPAVAQNKAKAVEAPKTEGYKFTDVKVNPSTPVKNQASSGTCWSYAGVAGLESDLLRRGKGEHDLSEMFIVRYGYINRAMKYLRMHGNSNFGQGGAAHDNLNVIEEYGIVPQEVYQGLNYGTDKNAHGELYQAVKSYMEAITKNPNRTLSTAWMAGLNGILDAYLGPVPEKFTYRGKEYTPKSFAAELGIKKSDFISVTSFKHHPYNTWFAIEIPDNTAWDISYNVKLDEMMAAIDNAIEKGYTVTWCADVSEKGFKAAKGVAVVPAQKLEDIQDSDKARWSGLTDKEREDAVAALETIVPEIKVTCCLRQQWFDNFQTTDDHLMEIVGTAKDQNGHKYYKVKNSWGDAGIYGGYFYASEDYVKGKTICVYMSREALPFAVK